MLLGEEQLDEELNLREKNQSVNKACMYIYTSGTTGPPKGKYSTRSSLWHEHLTDYIAHGLIDIYIILVSFLNFRGDD